MATTTDPSATAMLIARTMVHNMQIAAGQGAPFMAVRLAAEKNGMSTQDFAPGIEHGAQWGMFEVSSNWIKLTQAGFKAA
ncbi:MAG TPA: hypothetical protein VMF03_05380 [Steroidobacteraceae bacterium]|nr:hypothetical protein [Steroidobacteraceae bacterium]